jgi:hypothetical protein
VPAPQHNALSSNSSTAKEKGREGGKKRGRREGERKICLEHMDILVYILGSREE